MSNAYIEYLSMLDRHITLVENGMLLCRRAEEIINLVDKTESEITAEDDGVLCFRPLEPLATVQLDIVWKKNQLFSKAADLFLKRLYEAFGN